MSVQNVKKWQNSGELNWPKGFHRPLPYVGINSPEVPLTVSSVYLFWGSKVSAIGKTEKCPHLREPLSGTPTAQIGGLEMIAQCVPFTVRLKKWQILGELNCP